MIYAGLRLMNGRRIRSVEYLTLRFCGTCLGHLCARETLTGGSMKVSSWKHYFSAGSLSFFSFIALGAITLVVVACSSTTMTSTSTGSSMAQVSVRISDPATCQSPGGPFAHVFVTITDVRANVSSTAGDNDGGWVDLTPNLSKAPMQVDLLGQANDECFLA